MKEWLNGDGNNRWITLKPDKDGYWITLGYRDLVVSFDSGETIESAAIKAFQCFEKNLREIFINDIEYIKRQIESAKK